MIAPAKPLHDILEDEWDAQLFRGPKALATTLGWTSYHTLRSKGSKSGYPDRTLVRDRIIFAELKRERTWPTPAQVEWLDRLAAGGGEVYLWRPSDLDEIARILSKRWRRDWISGGDPHVLLAAGEEPLRPRSLWIPGLGRADATEPQTLTLTGST